MISRKDLTDNIGEGGKEENEILDLASGSGITLYTS